MCGIVGILSDHEAAPVLVEALRRLEYRGYDSAGIATVADQGRLDRRRAVGKLVNLSDLLVHNPLPGKSGIGHTRWATHGIPSEGNAHPHQAGRVAVVHNGIIENYKMLQQDLAAKGYVPQSDTDTETIALLAQSFLDQGLSHRDAAEQTIARLDGAYALAMMFEGEEDLIIVARKGPPLAIGYGDGEMFVGSDAIALAPLTDRITYLEEGDWAVVTRDGVEIMNANGQRANRAIKTIQIDTTQVEKGGHKHFMAKEIAEQPTVVSGAIHKSLSDGVLDLPVTVPDFSEIDRIVMVACGTAYYACAVAKYWFEGIANIPVEVDIASEYRYRTPPIGPKTLAVFVSQSGETADTLAALRYAAERARILSVVNVLESSIARESDVALPIHAGAEIGVASTKAFTCQLTVLATLVIKAASDRGEIGDAAVAARLAELQKLPGLMSQAMTIEGQISKISQELAGAQDILFLGRGTLYPLAMEGALKLKEISYIHAEGYASGELKHGPIALIDDNVPVIVMAPKDHLFEKTISNMSEVQARGGKIVLLTDADGKAEVGNSAWHVVEMPKISAFLAPILYAVPAQLLAYHTAVAKGTDVDQPRNLAKSVTVE